MYMQGAVEDLQRKQRSDGERIDALKQSNSQQSARIAGEMVALKGAQRHLEDSVNQKLVEMETGVKKSLQELPAIQLGHEGATVSSADVERLEKVCNLAQENMETLVQKINEIESSVMLEHKHAKMESERFHLSLSAVAKQIDQVDSNVAALKERQKKLESDQAVITEKQVVAEAAQANLAMLSVSVQELKHKSMRDGADDYSYCGKIETQADSSFASMNGERRHTALDSSQRDVHSERHMSLMEDKVCVCVCM
jgi:hypothetical protein